MEDIKWNEDLSRGTLKISNLMVLKSAAGYYIGRVCLETDKTSDDYLGGMQEPYSRESEYYPTMTEANFNLNEGFVVRDCVENNNAYANGSLPLGFE